MSQPPTADQRATLAQLRESVSRVESGTHQESKPSEAVEPETDQNTEQGPAQPESDQEAYSKARAVVLRKLTGSAKSRHQLAQTLRERDFTEGVIDAVLDRMEEVQLIDDTEFARIWVRNRHELKGLGSAALRRELQERGVGAAHIEEALDQLSAEDEDAAAAELIANKLRGVSLPVGHGPEERKEREKITRRLVGMLARRGHSPGSALKLVREAIETVSR
ncbi:MAG: regulatory protein RecX [Nesterenkonia sp.]